MEKALPSLGAGAVRYLTDRVILRQHRRPEVVYCRGRVLGFGDWGLGGIESDKQAGLFIRARVQSPTRAVLPAYAAMSEPIWKPLLEPVLHNGNPHPTCVVRGTALRRSFHSSPSSDTRVHVCSRSCPTGRITLGPGSTHRRVLGQVPRTRSACSNGAIQGTGANQSRCGGISAPCFGRPPWRNHRIVIFRGGDSGIVIFGPTRVRDVDGVQGLLKKTRPDVFGAWTGKIWLPTYMSGQISRYISRCVRPVRLAESSPLGARGNSVGWRK